MTKTLRAETITLIAKKLDIESGKMIYKEKKVRHRRDDKRTV